MNRLCNTGTIGASKPEPKTLNYMYYGYSVRKPFDSKVDGLSIDYVYPCCDGQMPSVKRYGGLDYSGRIKSFQRIHHPMAVGFEQRYEVAIKFGHYNGFQAMMRDMWRTAYDRLRDKLFDVDNTRFFHDCMNILIQYTNQYGESYGLPFAAQLPDMDLSSMSFQFGFVGQQPGIGFQLCATAT